MRLNQSFISDFSEYYRWSQSLSGIWRKMWKIRGKFPQQWRWWSVCGRHRGVSGDAGPSHICCIISKIRVKITQLWLFIRAWMLSSQVRHYSPTRIWRNISGIWVLIQPWRLSSMVGSIDVSPMVSKQWFIIVSHIKYIKYYTIKDWIIFDIQS